MNEHKMSGPFLALLVAMNLRRMFAEFGDCDEIVPVGDRVRVTWAGKGLIFEFVFANGFSMNVVPLKTVEGWEDNCEVAKGLMQEVARKLGIESEEEKNE